MTANCVLCISFGTSDVCYAGVAESYLYSSALILYYSIDLCTNVQEGETAAAGVVVAILGELSLQASALGMWGGKFPLPTRPD